MKARLDYICDTVAGVGTLLQPNLLLQNISLILTILSVSISLAFTLYKWYKDANKDGKIDQKEINSAISEVNKSINKINSAINESKKDGGNNG